MNKLTPMAMFMAGLVFTTGCASTPMPAKPKEYEVEFTLEINGKIVQRQYGKVREVEK